MTEHLPECWAKHESDPTAWCICDELRACEERVFALHPEWTVTGLCKPDCAACRRLTELITEWEYGYEKGLDAAREAVKSVNWFNDEGKMLSAIVATADSIAAIDALREKL